MNCMSHAECNMTQVECGTVGCPAACAGAAAGVGGFGTAASVGGFAAAACVGRFGAAPKAVASAGGLVASCVFAGGLEAGGGGLIDAKAPVVAAFGAVVRPKSGLGSCDASGAKCSGATDGPGRGTAGSAAAAAAARSGAAAADARSVGASGAASAGSLWTGEALERDLEAERRWRRPGRSSSPDLHVHVQCMKHDMNMSMT